MAVHRMKVSLPGVLNRAAGVCKGSKTMSHLEYPLKELLEHLRILRSQQDLETLAEFFDTWSDQGFEEWYLVHRPQVGSDNGG